MPDDSLTLPPKSKPKKHSRIGIVAPSLIVVVLFGLWSGYWFFIAHQVETRLQTQQQALIKAGYQVAVDPFKVSGYPYRMYVDLKNVKIVSPSGKGLSAPQIEAEANAYALTKWVMVAPHGLTLYRGHPKGVELGQLAVTGSTLKASISHLGRAVPNIAIQGTDVVLTPSDPTHPFVFNRADVVDAYTRPDKTDPAAADWLFRLGGARGAPQSMVGDLSPSQPLSFEAEGTLTHPEAFKGDISTGLASWSAAGGQVRGLHSLVKAGDLSLTATSPALAADASARLTGHIDLELSGTYKPLEALAAARVISPENLGLAKPLLGMTLSTNGPQTFGIDFKQGGAYIGFLKVSDAPVLP